MNLYTVLNSATRPWIKDDAVILWEVLQYINDLEISDFDNDPNEMLEEIFSVIQQTNKKINLDHAERNEKLKKDVI